MEKEHIMTVITIKCHLYDPSDALPNMKDFVSMPLDPDLYTHGYRLVTSHHISYKQATFHTFEILRRKSHYLNRNDTMFSTWCNTLQFLHLSVFHEIHNRKSAFSLA